jgi:hypothetical protein
MGKNNETPEKKSKFKVLKIILLSLLGSIALLLIAAFITGVTSSPEERKARNERLKQQEQKEQLEDKAEKEKELKEEEEKNRKHYSKLDAIVCAHDFVKGQLKSPSTAEFEGGEEGVIQVNDTIFTVKGIVDSQNSFGAMLRANFSCRVIFYPQTETCTTVDIVIKQ